MNSSADLMGKAGVGSRRGEHGGWGGRPPPGILGFRPEGISSNKLVSPVKRMKLGGLSEGGLVMVFLTGRLLAASCLLTPGGSWHHCGQVSKLGEFDALSCLLKMISTCL